jgi:UDP-2,3-diacylglucosamine pyrophosphatase LpxH
MKIQLLSDLHLEVHPQFVAQPAAGADVLVLAGDIGSYQSSTQVDGENFGLERFRRCRNTRPGPRPCCFVPGNHEYDMQDFDEARLRLQRVCDRLGLIWLDRETVVMDGVRFIGTTLWSDFDAMAMHEGVSDATRLHKLREKAFAPPISICKRPAAAARASRFWPRPCARKAALPGLAARRAAAAF